MSSEPTVPRLTIWPKRVLYLAWGCVALVVGQAQQWPMWQTALLLAPALLVEGFLFLYQKQKFAPFERGLVQRIRERESSDALLSFYHDHRLLKFAAPPWKMLDKLALIHRTSGHLRAAADAYRDALEEAPGNKAFPLAVGLADCLYELDELEEAERVYRLAQTEHELSGRAFANLSRIILKRGGDVQEAEEYLRLAADAARHPAVLRRELIGLLLDQGKLDDAQWELDKAVEQMRPDDDSEKQAVDEARALVEKARSDAS